MYFKGIIVISQWTRDQTVKRTSFLKSGRLKTLRVVSKEKWYYSHIRYYLHVLYCLVTIHDTIHIDESMMWHWLMRCHDPIRLKFLCTVDWWRGNTVDQKSQVRYMHHTWLFSTKLHHCSSRVKPCYCSNYVVKPHTVDWWRGAILNVQTIFNLMAMIYSMYL